MRGDVASRAAAVEMSRLVRPPIVADADPDSLTHSSTNSSSLPQRMRSMVILPMESSMSITFNPSVKHCYLMVIYPPEHTTPSLSATPSVFVFSQLIASALSEDVLSPPVPSRGGRRNSVAAVIILIHGKVEWGINSPGARQ